MNELYDPLIERDLDGFSRVARTIADRDRLWTAIARFAVLAYAPSQHGKRAVMACLAAHPFRDDIDWLIELARYAADSRPPWSEPPIFDARPSEVSLEEVLQSKDRRLAESWLAAHLQDAHALLRPAVQGDARLMLDAATGLLPLLGEQGRFALLRMPLQEMCVMPSEVEASPDAGDPSTSLAMTQVIDEAIAAQGAPDVVTKLLWATGLPEGSTVPLAPYELGRDYAQTLLVHRIAHTLPHRRDELLAAVHHNLDEGESFAEWSFA